MLACILQPCSHINEADPPSPVWLLVSAQPVETRVIDRLWIATEYI